MSNLPTLLAPTRSDEAGLQPAVEPPPPVRVDSRTSSLFDFLGAECQDGLSFDERFAGLSAFVDDLILRKHYHYRRVSLDGPGPVLHLQNPYADGVVTAINFASNDYLNLTRHPAVVGAAVDATRRYGVGTGASPAAVGNTDLHQRLEQQLARFSGCEEALVYNSGYGMNCGVLGALLRPRDLAILDSCVHASVMEGCKAAPVRIFDHNDLRSLESILARARNRYVNCLVVVEGVYSMDGDIAPLEGVISLARRYDARVMLDDAHGIGVLGATGRGTAEHLGLLGKVDIVAGTFSKSLGSVGGFVAGSSRMIRYLQMASRPYVFSAAPLASVAASVLAAIEVIESQPELHEQLWANIRHFRSALQGAGFDLGQTESAILPIMVRDDLKVKEMCRLLHDDGIVATAVVFPGVPQKQSRIRFSLSSGLERASLDYAIERITLHGKAMQVI